MKAKRWKNFTIIGIISTKVVKTLFMLSIIGFLSYLKYGHSSTILTNPANLKKRNIFIRLKAL